MKLSLPSSFQTFYAQHGLLELEAIFSPQEISALLAQFAQYEHPWKFSTELKKLLIKSPLGAISSFLTKKKPIRLAYLHTFPSSFPNAATLQEISSLNPILGGAFLCLESSSATSQNPIPSLTQQTPGHVIFFSPSTSIPFQEMHTNHIKGLLLAFAPQRTRYKLQPSDPHTHLLKRSGYAFGDLVKEEEVPYLYH